MIDFAKLRFPWSRRRPRFVDACIFCNEVDLLTIRIEELWDQVDYFIVVESNVTHSGLSKPLFFIEHQAKFKPYADKLIYRALTNETASPSPSEEERWARENMQRESITAIVSELDISPDDIVIISDVDEIPRASSLHRLDTLLDRHDYVIFVQTNFRGYINNTSDLALNGASWAGSVACRVQTVLREGAHGVRRGAEKSGHVLSNRFKEYSYLDDGGWHFSSFGGPQAFWLKAANFSHIDDPYRVIRLGETVPTQQVFSTALDREQCRALQRQYLAHCEAPSFSPLAFDAFDIRQDIPAYLRREKERFRSYFFFTDLN